MYMTLSCFYRTNHKFFIFWKQFSLTLKESLLVNENFHSPWRADEYNFPALSLVNTLFQQNIAIYSPIPA